MTEEPLSTRLRALTEPRGVPWKVFVGVLVAFAAIEWLAHRLWNSSIDDTAMMGVMALIYALRLDRQADATAKALKAIADEFEGIGR